MVEGTKENKKFRIYYQPNRYVEPTVKVIEDKTHFEAAYSFFATIWRLRDKELAKERYKLVVVRMSGNECENGTFMILQTYKDNSFAYENKDTVLVEILDENHIDSEKLRSHRLTVEENKK